MHIKFLRNSCAALLAAMAIDTQAMDLGRAEAGIDTAITRFGVNGQGVVVALIDRGIDWKNDDFRKDDGTTRIKWIFDLTDDTGAFAPGNTYGMGTIYTEAQLNTALTNGTNLAHRDAVGHGTTTAGIACGNGRGLASRKYRGVAPNASIIVVKVVAGAPAHGSEPAEANFYSEARVLVGMDFAREKALALGLPCVMIPNLGSLNGPTDGTSLFARKINSVVAPGILMVNGPGDDGGMPNRATGTVTQGGTASLQIKKGQTGNLRLDLWYRGADRFNVTIVTPSGTFGPFAAPANNTSSSANQPGLFNFFHNGASVPFYGAMNGKREIFCDINGPIGTYTFQLTGATIASDGRFDATMNPSTIFQPPANANAFLTFVHPGNLGNIWDGATASLNICPTDYVLRTNWIDIDGFARSNTGQGAIGEIWKGSSAGPTFDGRLGIDLAAPGDSLFTTNAPNSYGATFRFNLIQDGNGKYTRASAVSAAAPLATGVVALMLQMNPKLDAATAKGILQASARSDSFTGAVPNPQWGYGKLDAAKALSLTANTLLRVTQTQRTGNDIHVFFTSVVGKSYRAEFRDSLTSGPDWASLPGYTEVAGTGASIDVVDPGAATLGKRFYRIVPLL